MGIEFISGKDHYDKVIERVASVKKSLWIGTADIKDLHIKAGAGIGMKSSNRRNFEAGILTDDPALVEGASEQFDSVWRGEHCTRCGRRQYCPDPIR